MRVVWTGRNEEAFKIGARQQCCGSSKSENRGSIDCGRSTLVWYALAERLSSKRVVSPYESVAFQCAVAVFSFITSSKEIGKLWSARSVWSCLWILIFLPMANGRTTVSAKFDECWSSSGVTLKSHNGFCLTSCAKLWANTDNAEGLANGQWSYSTWQVDLRQCSCSQIEMCGGAQSCGRSVVASFVQGKSCYIHFAIVAVFWFLLFLV